jgi:hypothetical protein
MTTSSVPTNSFEWSSNSAGAGFIAQDIITLDPSIVANISAASGGMGNVTISNTTGSSYYYTGAGVGGGAGTSTVVVGGAGTGYTIGSGLTSSGTIGISPLTSDQINSFTFQIPVEWQDRFPDWDKVQKMCEEYPGLKIAFEKFQTTYKLVVDHYDTPEDQRPRP